MTPEMVTGYLRGRGLIEARDVVVGDLSITELPGRNANLRVESRTGHNYFIKQSPDDKSALLRVEAAVYARALSDERWAPLRRWLPQLHSFDDSNSILVMHRSATARDVFDADTDDDLLGLPPISSLLGQAIAACHAVPTGEPETHSFLGSSIPWALSIHRPAPDALESLWPAQVHVLRAVQQQAETGIALDRIAAGWMRTALIHGDLKFSNVLVETQPPGVVPTGVLLVDWETAIFGDPAWDLGSVLQSYLWFAVFLVSLDEELPAEAAPKAFAERLPGAQREMRLFWESWLRSSGTERRDSQAILERAVTFCGVRLLQTAYELAQGEEVPGRLTSGALQLGLNILRVPNNARTQLIGIPMPADET
jgi:hypothetical protein